MMTRHFEEYIAIEDKAPNTEISDDWEEQLLADFSPDGPLQTTEEGADDISGDTPQPKLKTFTVFGIFLRIKNILFG